MRFVLDASAAAAWLMPDERAFDLKAVVLNYDGVLAPSLFWWEVRNLLLVNERRGRLPEGVADELIEIIADLAIDLDAVPSNDRVMSLARHHNLTVYDASYLELAIRTGADLASFDRQLVAAAQERNVRMVPTGMYRTG